MRHCFHSAALLCTLKGKYFYFECYAIATIASACFEKVGKGFEFPLLTFIDFAANSRKCLNSNSFKHHFSHRRSY